MNNIKGIINKYSKDCNILTEISFRKPEIDNFDGNLDGKQINQINLYNIYFYNNKELLKNTNYKVINPDNLKEIPESDLILINTLKNTNIINNNLNKCKKVISKYIILYNTSNYENVNERGKGEGVNKAVQDFIEENKEWILKEKISEGKGVFVLSREGKEEIKVEQKPITKKSSGRKKASNIRID